MEAPSYFKRYLQAIQPQKTSRELAQQRHGTLRDRLVGDESFKDWFGGTFLYGSYRRNTAVQPVKDVDVCVLLNIDINSQKPKAVIDRLRRVLERNGYTDKTALQRRSVRIDLKETTLDVVPVVIRSTTDEMLWIPDRKMEQWVTTHPKGHLEAATIINKECNQRYIPFVKIIKAWYRYQMCDLRELERPKPKGFTLEAMVAQFQDKDAPSYAEAFIHFLENIDTQCGSQLEAGIFPQIADPGISGQFLRLNIKEDECRRFLKVVRDSLSIAKAALDSESLVESTHKWNQIFGPKFPRATSEASNTLDESADDSESATSDVEDIGEMSLATKTAVAPIKIDAQLSTQKYGNLTEYYPSGGRALSSNMWLRFSVEKVGVLPQYSIRWVVMNHGQEATEAGDIKPRVDGDGSSPVQWEHLKYRGSHTMVCEIHQNGVVVARGQHIVNVKGSPKHSGKT